MSDGEATIRSFFTAYAKRFNDALQDPPVVDTEGIINSFASYFVAADPQGVNGGKNGLRLRLMVPRGYAFYRKIGTRSMRVASLEVTPLDGLHFMAKVGWDSRYTKKDGTEARIEFENIYFLQLRDGEPKIFAYITGDERQVLRDHGLI